MIFEFNNKFTIVHYIKSIITLIEELGKNKIDKKNEIV